HLFVLGNDSGKDAEVAQGTSHCTAYIHNTRPNESNVPKGFTGVVTDDYSPQFEARVLGDLQGKPVAADPVDPDPAMPHYGRLQRLEDKMTGTAKMAVGAVEVAGAEVRSHFTDARPALEQLESTSAATPMRHLAKMAEQIMHDPVLGGTTKSAALLRLVTARGTQPGDADGVIYRTSNPDKFAGHLKGADLARFLALQQANAAKPGDWAGWQSYMDRATGTVNRTGNHVENLIDGEAAFPAQYEAIDHAKKFINLSIHTFASDESGWEYAKHLAEAASPPRNVQVRVLYDGFGSHATDGQPTDPRIYQYLKDHGVQLIQYKDAALDSHLSHRKILETDDGGDGLVTFCGGMNIADYHEDIWHDVFSRVTGPAAADLGSLFVQQWEGQGGHIDDAEKAACTAPQAAVGDSSTRVVGHVGLADQNMKLAYLRAIDTSEKSIDIADPYFCDKDVFEHLEAAAKRGVKVRLFWPAHDNQVFSLYAAQESFPDLLKAGVEIYKYGGRPMAHTKIAVFDNRLATVGSSNLDARSLVNNDEANIWTEDPQVANDLTQRYFEADLPTCTRLTEYHASGMEAVKNKVFSALANQV
ncbi:MAG TPA: phosphatidylserine/phosphatidylglycerophosphate/cardiolipin synthase family protein, partial [Candidatus Xenobia bacterium]